jgi:hypothetical protein
VYRSSIILLVRHQLGQRGECALRFAKGRAQTATLSLDNALSQASSRAEAQAADCIQVTDQQFGVALVVAHRFVCLEEQTWVLLDAVA